MSRRLQARKVAALAREVAELPDEVRDARLVVLRDEMRALAAILPADRAPAAPQPAAGDDPLEELIDNVPL